MYDFTALLHFCVYLSVGVAGAPFEAK